MKLAVVPLLLMIGACSDQPDRVAPSTVTDDIRAYIGGWDEDEDGSLTYDEFAKSLKSVSPIPVEDEFIRDTFAGYDLNADGRITVEEMDELLLNARPSE